ncbi:DNA alkylation repair protein [Hymenobacter busanensis]|uniref:DNA alkylation repair protein n=1 Tax=Hymenobacter busanensis TaxID=2607656 RepID=A0A7L4ZV61_9BACT|nr:DNA alkylation repair protein [Hymenobacter busanensis]KAA9332304.1 DNA alkylation repair protein [Hymenobacter busanensis]QHJ07359.1 DNA alkylation repair protein [Hymenobacter busanensis]
MTAADAQAAIHALANPDRVPLLARFFKTGPGEYAAGDQFLGLTMPQQRVVAKEFRNLPMAEVEQLVQSPWHDCRSIGLIIWTLQFPKAGPAGQQAIYERYLQNRRFVNNWDLVDITCTHIVGGYLLKKDRTPLYELVAEDNLWSQRMAMVSTLAFIRKGQFADTFALAEQLLSHRHDLIHKAVGWMLREVGKRNEEALEEFLADHRGQLPRTTLRYAIERFDAARRQFHLQK